MIHLLQIPASSHFVIFNNNPMSKTFFFENLDCKNIDSKLWNAPKKSLDDKVIHSGYLWKHSNNPDAGEGLTERYFMLQGEYLLYKQSEASLHASSAMNIKYAKVMISQADISDATPLSLFAFKICYKRKFTLLYARNDSEYQAWIDAFTSVMTRTDVHQRFNVEKPIGAGSFAQVFKAQELKKGKWFSIKGFNKQSVLESPAGRRSVWQEIQNLRKMKGRLNILNLHEVHETKNSIYLVMDYIEGGDLSQYITKHGPSSEQIVINITYGLLRGLQELESESILHRDLKPANIMLKRHLNITPDDVVIVDFGLAADRDDKHPIFKRCGTPGFIAPEVIAIRNTGPGFKIPDKCDLYSVGVIMHILCTGKSLFDKTEYDVDTVLRKNVNSQVDYPSMIFDNFSGNLLLVINGLLEHIPSRRLSLNTALLHSLFDQLRSSNILTDIKPRDTSKVRESLFVKINEGSRIQALPKMLVELQSMEDILKSTLKLPSLKKPVGSPVILPALLNLQIVKSSIGSQNLEELKYDHCNGSSTENTHTKTLCLIKVSQQQSTQALSRFAPRVSQYKFIRRHACKPINSDTRS